MSKTNGCYLIPAQTLLNDKGVSYSGFLERKSGKSWIISYIVISNGDVNIYKTKNSTKPCFVSPLRVYSEIVTVEGQGKQPLWFFGLKGCVEAIVMLKFAAPSEREMKLWINEFQMGIMLSTNLTSYPSVVTDASSNETAPFSRSISESGGKINLVKKNSKCLTLPNPNKKKMYKESDVLLATDNRNDKEESIYEEPDVSDVAATLTKNNEVNIYDEPAVLRVADNLTKVNEENFYDEPAVLRVADNLTKVNEGSIYDEPAVLREDDILTKNNKECIYDEPNEIGMNEVCIQRCTESIYDRPDELDFPPPSLIDHGDLKLDEYWSSDDAKENEESYMFYGTREEALDQMQQCKLLGIYLVRNENNRNVLTVRCEKNFMKFNILIHPETKRNYLAGHSMMFENLDHLIAYYHEHELPNQKCALSLPFKLYNNIV